jgi:hypothetical protein
LGVKLKEGEFGFQQGLFQDFDQGLFQGLF